MARIVRDISEAEFADRLNSTGLSVRLGPFDINLKNSVSHIVEPLYQLYANFPVLDDDRVFSFRAQLLERRNFFRPSRKVVRFLVDGRMPHEDMPHAQALAVLEWGVNLVIALRSHAYLLFHCAVLEKNKFALLLPAAPGFGKTTLCAALAHRGWRLFSDEFGLVRPGKGVIAPLPRPMALKNESIDVIRQFAPEAIVGPRIVNTRKGTVAHVMPPAECVKMQQTGAVPQWIVFPRWLDGADTLLKPMPKAEGFLMLARNAFNYELLGEAGFETVRNIITRSSCYSLTYSNLDDSIAALDAMALECD